MCRKCKSCFRFQEDEDDAKSKGYQPRWGDVLASYGYKPRKNVRTHCTCRHYSETISPDFSCEYHQYRWTWNLSQWWSWRVKFRLNRQFCRLVRIPLGGLRKPIPLGARMSYSGYEPVCTHCGEVPYSFQQCQFCGQRFSDTPAELKKTVKEVSYGDCTAMQSDNNSVIIFDGNGNMIGEVVVTRELSKEQLEHLLTVFVKREVTSAT